MTDHLGWIVLILATIYAGQTRCARLVPRAHGSMLCYSCNSTSSLDQCGSILCRQDGMVCYMDEVVTEQLTIEYNGGCRHRDVCTRGATGSTFGKRNTELYACRKCCDAHDYCNSKLCGIKAQPTTTPSSIQTKAPVGSGLLHCFQCNFKRDNISRCSKYGACHSNELCAVNFHVVDNGVPYYELGCMLNDKCELLEKISRITNQPPPAQCCNSSLCNQGPSYPGVTINPTTSSTAVTSSSTASSVTPSYQVACISCVNSTRDLPGCSIVQCDAATEECYAKMADGVVNAGCRAKQFGCSAAGMPGKRHIDTTSGSGMPGKRLIDTASGTARATPACVTCCNPSTQCLCNGMHCGFNNYAVLNLMNKANCFAG